MADFVTSSSILNNSLYDESLISFFENMWDATHSGLSDSDILYTYDCTRQEAEAAVAANRAAYEEAWARRQARQEVFEDDSILETIRQELEEEAAEYDEKKEEIENLRDFGLIDF